MRLRTRLGAVAAAVSLVGAIFVLGGTAEAQTVFIDCDQVAGTGKIKPGLTNQLQSVSASVKSSHVGACAGPLLATTGALTKVKGKLVGSASCNTALSDPTSPLAGKVTLVWTELSPKGKPFVSSTFLRVSADDTTLDALSVANGIVTKGPGVGYDIDASFLYQPTAKKTPGISTIDASGNIVPGPASLTIGTDCLSGAGNIERVIFGTDGTSLLGTPFDSSITLSLPAEPPPAA